MGKARTIYLDACARIAASFADDGFVYRPSKQSLVRKNGDLMCEVAFQSDARNFLREGLPSDTALDRELARPPGGDDIRKFGLVGVSTHAVVRSKALKVWRASLEKPLNTGDVVAGGQVGNLRAKYEWIEFNLANPERRSYFIQGAVDLIRSVALPYFARFSDPQEVIHGLHDGTIPSFWEHTALEYACCFGTLDQAKSLLRRFLEARPECVEEYRRRIHDYQRNGIAPYFNTPAGRLAAAALALGLEVDHGG
jgi:hypothetical protein